MRGVDRGGRTEDAERLEARIKADAVILCQGKGRGDYSHRARHLPPEAEVCGTYTADARQGVRRENVVAPGVDGERDEREGVVWVKGLTDGTGDVRRYYVSLLHGTGECGEVEELC